MRRRTTIGAVVAVAAMAATLATPAYAQTGGTGGAGASADPTFYRMPFGARDLSAGMTGTDVKTLNWALRGLALGTPYHAYFQQPTSYAVRNLQAASGLSADGVVNRYTRKAMASRMLKHKASWYGKGFFGRRTACGKKLTKKTIGVAHRKLPCGTRVVFAHRGRWVRAKVIDRGPYVKGRKWDLTQRLAKQLGALKAGTPKLKVAVAP